MYSADDLQRESGTCSDAVATGNGNLHLGKPATGSSPLGLRVSHPASGVCVVAVAGELDALTAPRLIECVRGRVEAGAVGLVIDLAAVDFLGSAGLGALIESNQAIAAAVPGSKLHLTGTSHRAVRRPLEMVGLLPQFDVHSTVDDALSAIAADSADETTAAG